MQLRKRGKTADVSDQDLLMSDVHILKFHTGKTWIHVIIIITFIIIIIIIYYCYNVVVLVVVVQVFQNGECLKHYVI